MSFPYPTAAFGALLPFAMVLAGCASTNTPAPETTDVMTDEPGINVLDTKAIIANDATDAEWPSYGLNYGETRYSQLKRIDATNVGQLGLAWSYDLESIRGVEATPLVVDGVMYVTGSWSIVHALDAVTGEKLWVYDPEVDRGWGYKGCCDVVNRGVALYKGRVYVGAYDGYLHAIDAATGERVWKVDTIAEGRADDRSYTITGAPRAINGKIVIGNGGAEYGVRGYVTAYDAESGDQAWRFYTVPNPGDTQENEALEMALKTWDPEGAWKQAGGGGTVWDAMAYDPDLNLLYIGVGNGSPWSAKLRSPSGGDNLFLSSIVAINPDTGEYAWHYQGTPGDNWDYTHTQHIIVTDLMMEGVTRKVVMQAPKNGFFYVLDAKTGEFISANNFVPTSWATGYDESGRPIENPAARQTDGESFETIPSAYGAHNWHPMSFNPDTGLVYLPAQHIPLTVTDDKQWEFNTYKPGSVMSGMGWNFGFGFNAEPPKSAAMGKLVAWDPVKQEEAWSVAYPAPWNAGTLTTAGNLVFQGTAHGTFVAYNAQNGEMLWETPVTSGVVAAPMTFERDGVQYISLAVGWGGVFGETIRAAPNVTPGKVLTFKVGGTAEMPNMVAAAPGELVQDAIAYTEADVGTGASLYVANCFFCHGLPAVHNGGNIPNLGYSDKAVLQNAKAWVLEGAATQKGMPSFKGQLTEDDVSKIVAFVQALADQQMAANQAQ
ncbi:MAG: PQQ-dependent dehydrogenase, methanol/ethanol family [Myxococcota bacterium]